MASWLIEESAEKLPCSFQSLLGQHHRLVAVLRVGDHALCMEPVHRGPVEALAYAVLLVEREEEKREHRVIDAVRVSHDGMVADVDDELKWTCPLQGAQ